MNQKERLVELLNNHCAVGYEGNDCTNPFTDDCAECLADYILADGWMRPPCKVGDVLYVALPKCGFIRSLNVVGFHLGKFPDLRGHKRKEYIICCSDYSLTHIDVDKFDKTVFLNREDAEKALRGDEWK